MFVQGLVLKTFFLYSHHDAFTYFERHITLNNHIHLQFCPVSLRAIADGACLCFRTISRIYLDVQLGNIEDCASHLVCKRTILIGQATIRYSKSCSFTVRASWIAPTATAKWPNRLKSRTEGTTFLHKAIISRLQSSHRALSLILWLKRGFHKVIFELTEIIARLGLKGFTFSFHNCTCHILFKRTSRTCFLRLYYNI